MMMERSLRGVFFLFIFLIPFCTPFLPAADNLRIEKVSESAYAVLPADGGKAFSNAAFIILEDGVLVVDSQSSPELAEELIAGIRKVTDKPIRFLVNTHFHRDHTAGNSVFPPEVRLILHPKTYERFLEEKVPATYPVITDAMEMGLCYKNKTVKILWLGKGHTEGDLIVYLPEEEVLIAGDLFFNQSIPYVKDGHLGQWISVIQRVLELKFQKVVPGHGAIGDASEFRRFRELLAWAKAVADAEIQKGTEREKIPKAARETELFKTRIAGYKRQEWLTDLLDSAYQEIQRSRGRFTNIQK